MGGERSCRKQRRSTKPGQRESKHARNGSIRMTVTCAVLALRHVCSRRVASARPCERDTSNNRK